MGSKVAIVTGAGKGVGADLTKKLLEQGINVIAVSRSAVDLKKLEMEHEQNSESALLRCVIGDVALEETWLKTEEFIKGFGQVDYLVNNAGIGIYNPLEKLTLEDYDKTMNSNMRSTFIFTKGVLPYMQEKKFGHIINIASVAGKKGLPNETIYCASKFAQVGFAQALDYEVRKDGIKVTSICPGGIDTNFAIGTGRVEGNPEHDKFLSAEDVTEAVMFVLAQSPKSRIIELFLRPMSEPL